MFLSSGGFDFYQKKLATTQPKIQKSTFLFRQKLYAGDILASCSGHEVYAI